MSIVWKRLNDSGKNWRHVYKSLVLLDFLIKCGNEKVEWSARVKTGLQNWKSKFESDEHE